MAVNYVRQYVRAIRAGTVTVSQPVRQVYERLDAEAADKACPYRFSAKLGDHAIRFIETFCRHYEGEHAGQLVKLELWEKAFIQTLLGGWTKRPGCGGSESFSSWSPAKMARAFCPPASWSICWWRTGRRVRSA